MAGVFRNRFASGWCFFSFFGQVACLFSYCWGCMLFCNIAHFHVTGIFFFFSFSQGFNRAQRSPVFPQKSPISREYIADIYGFWGNTQGSFGDIQGSFADM